jgi:hypothetical protein
MFIMSTDLPFADDNSPPALRAGWDELVAAFEPVAGGRDLGTFTEVGWSALHGLVILNRDGRLSVGRQEERLAMLVGQILVAARNT